MNKLLLLLLCFSSTLALAAFPESNLKKTYQGLAVKRKVLIDQLKALKTENRLSVEKLESTRESTKSILLELQDLTNDSRKTAAELNVLSQTFSTNTPLKSLRQQLAKALNEINAVTAPNHPVFLKNGSSINGVLSPFGPIAYFESSDHKIKGIAIEQNDLFLLKEVQYSGVLTPVYFSKKEALMDSEESFVTHLKKGKAAMIPMLVLAVVCLVVAIVRGLALIGVVKKQYEVEVKEIAEICMTDEVRALKLAQALPRPLNSIMNEAIKHREMSKDHLEEVLYERVTLEIPALDKWLTILAVGASAAPLLGLLGTVTGMIHTFALITQHGSGDAALLSSGISEALVTTEVGLVIAIPALVVHAWLSRKVSKSIALTQKGGLIFVNALKVK